MGSRPMPKAVGHVIVVGITLPPGATLRDQSRLIARDGV